MSADQEKFEVPEKVAFMSSTVKNMIQGKGRKAEQENETERRSGKRKKLTHFLLFPLRSRPLLPSQPQNQTNNKRKTPKTDIEKGDNVPLPNVSSKILAKIIAYCKFHSEFDEAKKAAEAAGGEAPAAGAAPALTDDDVKDHDAEFVKVDQSTLFELILAANYLNIKPLLDLTCLTVANMIKGKTPEEIRKTFNIPNDFTPEEEEEVRRENQWAFE